MADEQATNERTFNDALLHLKKAISHMDVLEEAYTHKDSETRRYDNSTWETVFGMAHDRVVKARNTVAYLSELSATQGEL